MAYVTQTDLERAAGGADRFLELADHDADGSIDATLLAETINDVERMVDGYIEPRHPVPLDEPVPDLVRRLVADEVVYQLRRFRQAVDEETRELHDENLALLRDISAGRVGLGLTQKARDRTPASAEVGDRADVEYAVTRDSLKGLW